MIKKSGMLLAVCLALGLLLAGCGGNGGEASGAESAQSAAGGQAAQSAASESADGSEGTEGAGGIMSGSAASVTSEGAYGAASGGAASAASENPDSAASGGDLSGASGSEGDSVAGASASPSAADPAGASAENAADATSENAAGTSASASAGSADGTANASASSSSSSASSNSNSNSNSASSSAASPKEKADDDLIDVYDFADTNDIANYVLRQLDVASDWGSAAVEGDIASIWAYAMKLDSIEPRFLEDEIAAWQKFTGTEEANGQSKVGFAVDGRVVYAYFGEYAPEARMSGFFDKDGRVVYLRVTAGDSYHRWAFKDDVLISHTGGWSNSEVMRPQYIGDWDEGERLAEQERLLDIAYSNFALLKVDDMEAVGEIPYDQRYKE